MKPTPIKRPPVELPQALEEETASVKKRKMATPVEPIYGISDPHGHVITQIRKNKPALYHKLKNWD